MGEVKIKHCIVSSMTKILLASRIASKIIDPMSRVKLHLIVGISKNTDQHFVYTLHTFWSLSAVKLRVLFVKNRFVCVLSSADY